MEDIKTCYELFGVECGEGWYSLLKPIFNYIDEYNKDKNEEDKIVPLQIKEKFGELRFYANFYTKELEELISQAEYEASQTCEICGSKNDIGFTIGWITTCCKDCVLKMVKNSHYPKRWHSIKDKCNYWVHDDGRFEKIESKDANNDNKTE